MWLEIGCECGQLLSGMHVQVVRATVKRERGLVERDLLVLAR